MYTQSPLSQHSILLFYYKHFILSVSFLMIIIIKAYLDEEIQKKIQITTLNFEERSLRTNPTIFFCLPMKIDFLIGLLQNEAFFVFLHL